MPEIEKKTPPIPRPQPLCDFADCTVPAMYGFREPGIANLPHRNPHAVEVWTCPLHRDDGTAMLEARVAAAAHERIGAMAIKARRSEGKLL